MKRILLGFALVAIIFFPMIGYSAPICTIDDHGTSRDDTDCDGIADIYDNCVDVSNGDCDVHPKYCVEYRDDALWEVDCPGLDADECAATITGELMGFQLDVDGDDKGDVCDHSDDDNVVDAIDNCRLIDNTDQADANSDGIGDACTDTDWDGWYDSDDNCELVYNTQQRDDDDDGEGNACDNCPLVANEDQIDDDHDGRGDACANDYDGDGIPDEYDNCPETPNADQIDIDNDSVGDVCDNCPTTPNNDQLDTNGDGLGDLCEASPNIIPPMPDDFLVGEFRQGSGGCSLTAMTGVSRLTILIGMLAVTTLLAISRRR